MFEVYVFSGFLIAIVVVVVAAFHSHTKSMIRSNFERDAVMACKCDYCNTK